VTERQKTFWGEKNMQSISFDRRLSRIFLSLIPFLIFGSAFFRGLRRPIVYPVVVGLAFIAIVVAAWRLGASATTSEDENRKGFLLAGAILISAWAVLSVLVGLGPPWRATEWENTIRFTALLVAGVLITGGFVVLKEPLREAGERLYSALGFAAIMLAGPLFAVSVLIPLTLGSTKQPASAGQVQDGLSALRALAESGLVVEVFLTYIATAVFALALSRVGWMGRTAGRVYAGISLFAVLCLATTVVVSLQYTDPMAVLKVKIALPGFIVSIPAIPFIMPHLIGVNLLRRASERTVTR
jgi:hypothetical protein